MIYLIPLFILVFIIILINKAPRSLKQKYYISLRESIASWEDKVGSLTKIGDYDVNDCALLIKKCFKSMPRDYTPGIDEDGQRKWYLLTEVDKALSGLSKEMKKQVLDVLSSDIRRRISSFAVNRVKARSKLNIREGILDSLIDEKERFGKIEYHLKDLMIKFNRIELIEQIEQLLIEDKIRIEFPQEYIKLKTLSREEIEDYWLEITQKGHEEWQKIDN